MASSFSDLGIELMATGENAGTWGDKTNTNLQIVEKAVAGYVEKAITSGGTTALTITDGDATESTSVARHAVIKLTGTISDNSIVTVPDSIEKVYIVVNGTSGSHTVQFKTASGTGVTFAATEKTTKMVFSDGTNIVDTGFALGVAADDISTGDAAVTIATSTGDITIDSPADIVLDADGGDVFFKDGGTTFGSATNTSGNLIIKSGTTTAATFSGANVTLAGTVGSGAITSTGTVQGTTITATTAFVPDASDGAALGTSSLEFSDLFLADAAVINLGADQDVTITHVADTGILLNAASVIQFRDSGLTIGSNADGDLDIVSDGTAVDSINIESAGGITLDAGTAANGIIYEDDGTEMMRIHNSSSDVIIEAKVQDKDIIFKGDDNGSTITALTLDMSAAGAASFNAGVTANAGIETKNGATGAGFVKFFEDSDNGTNAITLQGPASTSDVTFTLPSADGSSGHVLRTDGSGNLSFVAQSVSSIAADDISIGDAAVTISTSSGNITIDATANDTDIIFKGTDNTADITMLTLDGSDAGTATFNHDIILGNDSFVQFGDAGEKMVGDGTDLTINSSNDLNLTATTDINIPANVGLTFGDDGEKIEGDGTDLTIAGNNINLTAVADVVIPANVGITFGSGEKIEGDSTDLTVTSGGAINLTATTDVVIPNNVGIQFGGASEKIEGDGTDLVISANNLTIDAAADIILDAAGNDFNFKADGTEVLRITNSSSDVIIRPVVDAKDIIFQQADGTEVARVEDNGTFNVVTDKLAINGTAVTSTATELNKLDGAGTIKQAGKETIWVPAIAMYANSTNGAEAGQVELSNGPEIKVLDFDKDSDEFAQFAVAFPKSWNAGTVTFQAFFTATSTDTGTTAWGLSAVALADNGDLNTAFGTQVVATAKAHSGTSNDLNVAAESGAVTIAGSPGADEYVFFQISRDVSADDLNADARLLGIKLFFTTNAANDS